MPEKCTCPSTCDTVWSRWAASGYPVHKDALGWQLKAEGSIRAMDWDGLKLILKHNLVSSHFIFQCCWRLSSLARFGIDVSSFLSKVFNEHKDRHRDA